MRAAAGRNDYFVKNGLINWSSASVSGIWRYFVQNESSANLVLHLRGERVRGPNGRITDDGRPKCFSNNQMQYTKRKAHTKYIKI